jgi:hypothetical protein
MAVSDGLTAPRALVSHAGHVPPGPMVKTEGIKLFLDDFIGRLPLSSVLV